MRIVRVCLLHCSSVRMLIMDLFSSIISLLLLLLLFLFAVRGAVGSLQLPDSLGSNRVAARSAAHAPISTQRERERERKCAFDAVEWPNSTFSRIWFASALGLLFEAKTFFFFGEAFNWILWRACARWPPMKDCSQIGKNSPLAFGHRITSSMT